MDRQYPADLVSLFVWKPFLAIREIAAAGSKLQYAALPQLRKSHAWFLLSRASPHLRFWRAPQTFRICADWLLQAARSCGRRFILKSSKLEKNRKQWKQFDLEASIWTRSDCWPGRCMGGRHFLREDFFWTLKEGSWSG